MAKLRQLRNGHSRRLSGIIWKPPHHSGGLLHKRERCPAPGSICYPPCATQNWTAPEISGGVNPIRSRATSIACRARSGDRHNPAEIS